MSGRLYYPEDLTVGTRAESLARTITEADITNFAAEKWVRGQKVEAAALKLTANTQGFYTRGDVTTTMIAKTKVSRKLAET